MLFFIRLAHVIHSLFIFRSIFHYLPPISIILRIININMVIIVKYIALIYNMFLISEMVYVSYETYLKINNYYFYVKYIYTTICKNNDDYTPVTDYLKKLSTEELNRLVEYINEIDNEKNCNMNNELVSFVTGILEDRVESKNKSIMNSKELRLNDLYYELFKIIGTKFSRDCFIITEYDLASFLYNISHEELEELNKYSLSTTNKCIDYKNSNKPFANEIFNKPIDDLNLSNKNIELLATSEYLHYFIKIFNSLKDIYGSSMDRSDFLDTCSYSIYLIDFRRIYQILSDYYDKPEDEEFCDLILGEDVESPRFVLSNIFRHGNYRKTAFALFLYNLINDSFTKKPIINNDKSCYEVNLSVNSDILEEAYGKPVFLYSTRTCIRMLRDLEIISQRDKSFKEVQRIRISSTNLLSNQKEQ